MAQVSTNIQSTASGGFFRRLGAGILAGFESLAEASSRRDQILRLQAKSDADLAKLGIERDEIVTYVFRDKMY